MSATWYLGPQGDLRALTCPEPDIGTSVTRYGGVHQGLSGARTMDVTGHRAQYDFKWTNLDPAEWSWLEALHLRHIPGPFRLINPMKVNRLTPEATSVRADGRRAAGVLLSSGIWSREWDWPSAAGIGAQCLRWTNWTSTSTLRFDVVKLTAVFPLETVTGSVWLRSETNTTVNLVIDHYDRTGQISSSTLQSCSLTATWQRFTITRTMPAGATACLLALITASGSSVPIRAAAAQVVGGASPLTWEMGGGAPVVLLDQLETTSHRFPTTDCSMTLLEA